MHKLFCMEKLIGFLGTGIDIDSGGLKYNIIFNDSLFV